MNNIINIFKKLNKKAIKNNDIPVSCLILKNNKIISYAYNMREKRKNPINHAEIIAIQKAAKKMNTWNLSDCELYVTLKPCNMCLEVIKSAHIKKVNYILDNNKIINNSIKFNKIGLSEYEYFEKEIKDFFADKR